MKIAIVHDYIKEYGGAERVLEALHNLYPDAPVFTLICVPQFLGPHRERFTGWTIKTSFLQYLPFNYKFISIFRLIAPLVFKTFNFYNYDVIIVSATGAYNPNIISKKSAKQICYCHTPPRYLYGYATARNWKRNIVFRVLGEIANHFLRLVDYESSKNVDLFIANSENVKKRIEKFYKRDAVVVYPPITGFRHAELVSASQNNLKRSRNKFGMTQYYITGGRLARAKHVDLIIDAFKELKLPLKVFGKGFAGYEENIKYTNKKSKIELLGEVSDEEKLELMKSARAFIIAAEDEDFGIVPVEAMSVGTPVIAYKSGGLLESVIEGKTGIFFDELSTKSLKEAVKRFKKMKFNSEDCIKQAEKFSEDRFKKEMKRQIASVIK